MIKQLQDVFERPLSRLKQQQVQMAFHIMDLKTARKKLPRLFQMRAALAVLNGNNLVVRAGTGSGKTLAMALPMLLRPDWIFVTVAPLMALQAQHVSRPLIYRSAVEFPVSDFELTGRDFHCAWHKLGCSQSRDTTVGQTPTHEGKFFFAAGLRLRSNYAQGYTEEKISTYYHFSGAVRSQWARTTDVHPFARKSKICVKY